MEGFSEELKRVVDQFRFDLDHLYESIIYQGYQLQVVNEIGQKLLSKIDDKGILRRLMQDLIDIFNVERASFWTVDYDNNVLRYEFGLNKYGQENEISGLLKGSVRPPQIGEGIVGKVAQSGIPKIENDMLSSSDVYRAIDEESGFEENVNTLSVPLTSGGLTIGVIQLFNKLAEEGFSSKDRDLLVAISPWLGIALKNADNYKHISFVNAIGRKLISTIDYRETLRNLIRELIREFKVERGSFWLVKEEKVYFEFSLNKDGEEDEISDILRKIKALDLGEGIVGKVAQKGEAIIDNNLLSSSQTLRVIDEKSNLPPNRNMLSVPLKSKQNTIGVIQILNREDDRPFTVDDKKTLLVLTPWISQALENATLYEQALQREHEEHQKRLEAELDARATAMTRVMAHHIKNELGSASTYLEYILESGELSQESVRFLEKVDSGIERSIDLIAGLFRPYQSGNIVQVSPYTLVSEAFGRIAKVEQIKFENDVPKSLPLLQIDREHAVHFLIEILTNAVKAVKRRLILGDIKEGFIRVTGQGSKDTGLELRFINNGPSIPLNKQDSIFEQFSGEFSEKSRGNFGLGLWGARIFFRKNNGDIAVEKSDSNETIFLVRLPFGF
ncbi:MAG: GAF domain-containing protein [Chloroflexi bacterium]|nr:GAF domain-containing protein [Chloroflexota bacterium]